jgi:GNAT superfamily N-acetyltransferase
MRYPKEVVLKQGTEASIRPLEKDDEELLKRFYLELPERDRWYMKYDVSNPDVIHKWIDGIGGDSVFSTIALCENRIVGHSSLHKRDFGSTKHVGRLRIMVAPEYQRKRLGTWMLVDTIQYAMDLGLEMLRADFTMGVENTAIEAAYKLDFFQEAVLRDYVRDQRGYRYDLLIMIKRLHKDWGDF